jgi:hypothetical protein
MSENRSSTQPAGLGGFSAADMKRRMAEHEAAKAAEELRHMNEQEEKQKAVMEELIRLNSQGPYELHDRSKCESHLRGRTTHHFLIFETAGGFCGIAWNSVGITPLPVADKEAPKRPNEFCCDAYPAPNPARPPRGWRRPSSL